MGCAAVVHERVRAFVVSLAVRSDDLRSVVTRTVLYQYVAACMHRTRPGLYRLREVGDTYHGTRPYAVCGLWAWCLWIASLVHRAATALPGQSAAFCSEEW